MAALLLIYEVNMSQISQNQRNVVLAMCSYQSGQWVRDEMRLKGLVNMILDL